VRACVRERERDNEDCCCRGSELAKEMNRCQFKDYLNDTESEEGNIPWYTEVHSLNRGQVLKFLYYVKIQIKLLLEMKAKPPPELCYHD
jgi:hypothetical protein